MDSFLKCSPLKGDSIIYILSNFNWKLPNGAQNDFNKMLRYMLREEKYFISFQINFHINSGDTLSI